MALWGNIDAKGSGGTVGLTGLTVTGSGTTFGQVGAAATGDIIRFGDVNGTYFGDAVIVGIASTTQLSIASASNLSGASIAATTFTISQLPKFTTLDSHYKVGVNSTYESLVYGVDANEMGANSITDFDITHAGWVGVTTYLDWDGNLRVKSEVFVAMSSIVNDANDDVVFPDRYIKIIAQPVGLTGVSTTQIQNISVVAASIPSTALSYEWQYSSNAGVAYTAITSPVNNIVYTGTTGTTLGIGTTTVTANRPDGYYYRVKVYDNADANVVPVFSTGVILDYA